jgi:uncharacterized protein (DUF433 family)
MQVVESGHNVVDPEVLRGKPHIARHRIAVSHVAVWVTHHGLTPADIADQFHLTLGEVYAALSYYYDHKAQMNRDIAASADRAEAMGNRYPQGWNQVHFYFEISHGRFSGRLRADNRT